MLQQSPNAHSSSKVIHSPIGVKSSRRGLNESVSSPATTKRVKNGNSFASPGGLISSPKMKNNEFHQDDFEVSNANRSKLQDRTNVSQFIESEQSQGNYNLNKINLPDHDQHVSPKQKSSTVKRGDSPHFSYRNKRASL